MPRPTEPDDGHGCSHPGVHIVAASPGHQSYHEQSQAEGTSRSTSTAAAINGQVPAPGQIDACMHDMGRRRHTKQPLATVGQATVGFSPERFSIRGSEQGSLPGSHTMNESTESQRRGAESSSAGGVAQRPFGL